ncbi:biliverdin-producing heme oxygenase [Rhodobium gokarnense]|uniref:Heme oxygenase n=1 Tax=Rhodobium gokarnense TaxID=364296 RepID=A0ABT3HBS8_9HYPH|nr:biliverdin-producing heme oxygenase [Rhodobium gokarnense]MCW2307799.1 heme oxygenase [Rhodobium gokarnense]
MTDAVDVNSAVRNVLRDETWGQHKQLHLHASFRALFKGTLDRSGYRALILRLYGFYVPLDAAIAETLGSSGFDAGDYAYHPRAPLFAQDLVDLGLDDAALAAAPRSPEAGTKISPNTLGGVLYVVEGSTHGGGVIDRAARDLLGDGPPDGRRYWDWCRTKGAYRWEMTNRLLLRLKEAGTPQQDLIKGARQTFQSIADWLMPLDRPSPSAGRSTESLS